ncbi:ATP-binding protein [Streptomyces erythrochromogenes]|uniref:ATP-binding protein n=1 Tax=Streptomyces erythrochromogenes TaxID=285574 RepID=UPI0036F63646
MKRMSLDVSAGPFTASVADARAGTRDFLDRLVQPLSPQTADDVVLVVSELVTNALRHGGGTCTLTLTAHADGIKVAVQDPSPHTPHTRTPDLRGGSGGFGWPMVNHLAQATAVTHGTTGGKTVSALLPR